MPDPGLPRAVPLDGASNLRDLGLWPFADGRRVRPGLVFRSAALGGLTEADRARLAPLGLRTVVDLRGERERARAPTRLPGAEIVPLPIEPTVGASLRDILRTREATGEDLMVLMRRAYEAYALACIPQYRALFGMLLDEARLPLLFHCSAGKDRTGFAAALVLTALGADRETVLADYLATNRLWRADAVLAHDLPAPAAEVLLRAHAPLLDHAFEAIQRTDGSVEAYLERALGLTPARRARLRALLTEGNGGQPPST